MRQVRRAFLGLVILLVAAPALADGPATAVVKPEAAAALYHDLPSDPLLVMSVSLEDPASQFEGFAGLIGKLGEQDAHQKWVDGLARLDSMLGLSLGEDLLSQLGPEITFSLDLLPIDQAVSTFQFSGMQALETVLGKTGILARVRDASRLDRSLRLAVVPFGGRSSEEDGLVRIRIPVSRQQLEADPEAAAFVDLYYRIREDRLALGFSPDWVAACLDHAPADQRLAAGADYARVFASLDPDPDSLTYINLPKLRELLASSLIVRAVVEGSEESGSFLRPLLASDVMAVGLGSTSVHVNGGVRTTNFGPQWMSGAAVSGGLLAALAVPNLLVAADQARSHQTLTDIRSIAVACEGFSDDALSYPGPTDGWVPVETISAFLEPGYIGTLPRIDAWQNPILYWSDGSSYRILSMGQDGRMDRDWSGAVEPTKSARRIGDIVFGDGRLLVVPTQLAAE